MRALDTRISDAIGTLSSRQTGTLLLGISLFFAGAMIAVSWFLKPESSQTLIYMLIAVWWIPFTVLTSASNRSRRARCGKQD